MKALAKGLHSLVVAGVLLLGSCGEGEEEAYARGWNAGYDAGLADGRTEGRAQAEIDHQKRWGLIGLAVGAAAGAALVALGTRKHLVAQWRRRRRRKEIERLVGSCKVELDDDLYAEVVAIARKKLALQDRLERDDGPLIGALADRLRPELLRLDSKLLDLAALLQQLRDLRLEAVPNDERPAPARECASSGRAAESESEDPLREAQEQRRREVQRNADNIARCESQLAGLAAFLDELTMRVGNLKTVEQLDAFERLGAQVGEEVDALGAAFETTMARLAQEP